MTDQFEAVANGTQRRARWRCADGWMRVERLSDHHLQVRGPRADLHALAHAVRNDWCCVMPAQARMPDQDDPDGMLELMLVRNPAMLGDRPRGRRARRRTVASLTPALT
jgi:hypothetical protein